MQDVGLSTNGSIKKYKRSSMEKLTTLLHDPFHSLLSLLAKASLQALEGP